MDMPIIKQKLKEKLQRVNVRMNEAAKDDAEKLGLDYMSFGRWGKDGKVTHKTKNGKLVALSAAASKTATEKEPSDPEQDIGPQSRVNPAPDKVVKSTSTGANQHKISHADAPAQLPGLIKSLMQQNPGTSLSIVPGPDGIEVKVVPANAGSGKKLTIDVGPLSLDAAGSGDATLNGQPLKLSATENKLLTYLAGNQNKVVTRGQLLDKVWNAAPDIQTRTVDMHIARLKKRLGQAGNMIQNVRGMGYRITPPGA